MFSDNKSALRFIFSALSIYLSWYLIYQFVLIPDGRLDTWLTTITTEASAKLLNIFGAKTVIFYNTDKCFLFINGARGLGVAHNCNGLILFVLFSVFVLLFPGRIKDKLWFIPAGILSIFILNILRIIYLGYINIHYPHLVEFNHKYTFTVIVYGFIFILWMIWVNLFAVKVIKTDEFKS